MSASVTEHAPRRVLNNPPMQVQRDFADDRYRDLRRPRKLKFFVNGDRYFRGKKIYVTPNRYYNFNDLLNDLTGKLPSNLNLPYGVRQIFTPVSGRRIFDIEDLSDGETYVCAGFEGFKMIKYGRAELEPWSMARPQQPANTEAEGEPATSYRYRGYANNAFHPGRYFRTNHSYQQRRWPGTFGNQRAGGAYGSTGAAPGAQSDNAPGKPKVITIVRSGPRPRHNVKILLNRRSVQSYEQLVSDISEAFGPRYRLNKVRKLVSVRGREVQGVS
ncbi:neuronal migration protein doublecortin, partial [Aplysia californica]